MKKNKKIRAIMPVATLIIFSGCAKQAVTTTDAPLGGHVHKNAQEQSAPVPPLPILAKKHPVRQELAGTIGNSGSGESLKSGGRAASAAAASPLQAGLEKIYFDIDSSLLSATAKQSLEANYRLLQKNVSVKIRIEGNCDERGSDEYNFALGERRAKAAANYLTTRGISGDRIFVVSLGEEHPAVPGHDETAWAMNRRDEFIITGK